MPFTSGMSLTRSRMFCPLESSPPFAGIGPGLEKNVPEMIHGTFKLHCPSYLSWYPLWRFNTELTLQGTFLTWLWVSSHYPINDIEFEPLNPGTLPLVLEIPLSRAALLASGQGKCSPHFRKTFSTQGLICKDFTRSFSPQWNIFSSFHKMLHLSH